MDNFWDRVKQTLDEGATVIREGAEHLAKTVSDKAPGIAATIAEKSKELVALGQLKLKHYNLSHDVSNQFVKLGRVTFKLLKENSNDIYKHSEVLQLIDSVKQKEHEIDGVEKDIERLRARKEMASGLKNRYENDDVTD